MADESAGPPRSGPRRSVPHTGPTASVRDASRPTRRDRHDRRHRGPLAWPRTPSMLSRSAAFDQAILRAVDEAEKDWSVSVHDIEIGVEDVPPSDPTIWEDAIPLGRAFPAEGQLPPRMVLYRLPIQTRSADDSDRDALVRHVVRAQLGQLLGRDIEDDT